MKREKTVVHTTIGDLIVALTEEAMRIVHDEQEAYKAVGSLLPRLLRRHEFVHESRHA